MGGGSRYGAVPLIGDYDDDGIHDPTLYVPISAQFEILRSNAAYAKWVRSFDTRFSPGGSSFPSNPLPPETRAGAIPLEGTGILAFSRPALYFPHDGTWNTLWDVATFGAPVASCTHGAPDDFWPVTGIDRDADWRTDMTIFRAPSFNGSAELQLKKSAGGACTGVVTTRTFANANLKSPRVRVFSAHDMTGDGKSEIILLDPESMTFYWATSESDYATLSSRQLGSQKSIPL
jgi:hypothetical protein